MSFSKILVHAVWSTKYRKPLLNASARHQLFNQIRLYAASKNIHLLEVNGYTDHVHGLISLSVDQNIAQVVQLLKGYSSNWANKHLGLPEKFGWQNEYFAVSVSQSHLERVRNYIRKQELHHAVKAYAQEYEEFIVRYHFNQ
jgi:REP element-mobilizing transposase RayT